MDINGSRRQALEKHLHSCPSRKAYKLKWWLQRHLHRGTGANCLMWRRQPTMQSSFLISPAKDWVVTSKPAAVTEPLCSKERMSSTCCRVKTKLVMLIIPLKISNLSPFTILRSRAMPWWWGSPSAVRMSWKSFLLCQLKSGINKWLRNLTKKRNNWKWTKLLTTNLKSMLEVRFWTL